MPVLKENCVVPKSSATSDESSTMRCQVIIIFIEKFVSNLYLVHDSNLLCLGKPLVIIIRLILSCPVPCKPTQWKHFMMLNLIIKHHEDGIL